MSSQRFRDIVQQALERFGVVDVDPSVQAEAWAGMLGQDIPGFQAPPTRDGLPALESTGVQPSWLSSACDDVVFGEGAKNVVALPYSPTDEVRIVAGSQRAGVMGYLVVMRDEVAQGLIPVPQEDASVSDAFTAAVRVKAGTRYVLVHEGLPLTEEEADAMALDRASLREVEMTLAQRPPRASSTRDALLAQRVMTVEFPTGYCYLHSVEIEDRLLAVRKLGGSPTGRSLRRGMGAAYRPSAAYSQGRCKAIKVAGTWHMTCSDSPVPPFQDAREVLATDSSAVVGTDAAAMSPVEKLMEAFGIEDESSKYEEEVVSREVFELSVAKPKAKVYCGECGFKVTKEGHAERCRKRVAGSVKARFDCSVCGFKDVVKQGHEERCRLPEVPVPGERRLALIGDGQVALDVKMVIASIDVPEKVMTVEAANYLSAAGQRKYMEEFYPDALGPGRSDHSWSTAFEVRYHGAFRIKYLRWFWSQVARGRELLGDVTVEVSKERSALQVLGLVQGGPSSVVSSTSSGSGSDWSAVAARTRPNMSMARKLARYTTESPLLRETEVALRERLRREFFRGSFRGDAAYVDAVKDPGMAGYRRSFRSLLSPVVGEGAVQEFHLAAQYRGSYVLAVLYGLVDHLGVTSVDVLAVGDGFATVAAGEYSFLLPLPRGLYASASDYTLNVCSLCSRAHWVRSNAYGGRSQGCGIEPLERAVEAFYARLLQSALVE